MPICTCITITYNILHNPLIKDHLGSTRAVIDGQTGDIVETRNYYPFGKEMPDKGSLSDNNEVKEKYTGKELDNNVGLYYFGARYYDTDVIKWMSIDPNMNNYPSLSPYVYSGNNPIYYIDVDGRKYEAHIEELFQYAKNRGLMGENTMMDGRLVKELLHDSRLPGRYMIDWDGRDNSGVVLKEGVYIYEFITGGKKYVGNLMSIR